MIRRSLARLIARATALLCTGCIAVSVRPIAPTSPIGGGSPGDTAIAFAVDDYSACGGLDLNYCGSFASVFRSAFARGGWSSQPVLLNQDVRARYWSDLGKQPRFGSDSEPGMGVDSASVALLCGHGAAYVQGRDGIADFFRTTGSWFSMGGNPDSALGARCLVDTDRNMRFGNSGSGEPGKLEIAILATCFSAERAVWDSATSYRPMVDPDGTFSTWLGFNGQSYDSLEDTLLFRRYLSMSFGEGLGDNWLDVMFHPTSEGYDQCPAAIIFCTDPSDGGDCDDQFNHAGFNDRYHVRSGTKTDSRYYTLAGCEPKFE